MYIAEGEQRGWGVAVNIIPACFVSQHYKYPVKPADIWSNNSGTANMGCSECGTVGVQAVVCRHVFTLLCELYCCLFLAHCWLTVVDCGRPPIEHILNSLGVLIGYCVQSMNTYISRVFIGAIVAYQSCMCLICLQFIPFVGQNTKAAVK